MTYFLTAPLELLVAVIAATVLFLGWRSFSTPARGIPVILAMLPVLKTAASGGILVRFALPDVFIFLVFLGTLVLLLRGRDPGWADRRVPVQVLVGLAAFFVFVGLSFFMSRNVLRSGIEVAAYSVNLVFFALVILHVRTRDQLFTCLRAWEVGVVIAVAGSVVGVCLLFAGIFDVFFTEGPKVASTFKKSGQLSAYLLPSLPILWFNYRHLSATRRARVLRGALIVGTYLSIVAAGSRGGFVVGALLLAVLFGGPMLGALRGRRLLVAGAAVGLACFLAAPLWSKVMETLPFTFHRAFSILDGTADLESLSPTRYHQFLGWKVAAAEYPWVGVGTGDFRERATSLVPQAWLSHEIHNTYLGVWAETGLFGIFALTLFYLGIVRTGWQVVARGDSPMSALGVALLVAAVALFIYGTMNFGLRMRHLWCVFALIVAAWNVVMRECGAESGAATPARTPGSAPAPAEAAS
ncbi:MAG TPA: O-antigen ligase family protein [bacterium]|nr:O-antigen ligase family protein [bacterium]